MKNPWRGAPGGYIRPRALAWSPDGTLLATGCEQHAALWDLVTLNQIGFPVHDGTIAALAWSPNGHTLASCSKYGRSSLIVALPASALVYPLVA